MYIKLQKYLAHYQKRGKEGKGSERGEGEEGEGRGWVEEGGEVINSRTMRVI